MKKVLAVFICCLFIFSIIQLPVSARSGKLDENIAAETRALAVETEAEAVACARRKKGIQARPRRLRNSASRIGHAPLQGKDEDEGLPSPGKRI